jgi:YVTN family beta-propeller protein
MIGAKCHNYRTDPYALLYALLGFLLLATVNVAMAQTLPLSPVALAASSDGKVLYVACATANRVLCFDVASRKVLNSIPMPESPSGLALSADDKRLYVTCTAPESKVCIVDVSKPAIVETIPVGHTAMAPVLSPDGKTLYICNRFNNNVSIIDLAAKKEVCRIAVQREPVAATITKDGKYLLVANHLHNGRADVDYVAAVVSVIDLAAGKVVKELQLPNGSGVLKDIRVSPDGKYAVVTHLLAQFNQPTTRIYRGWMNANVMTIIDLARMEILHTVPLDDAESGAANPWGLAWSPDSATILVTHAGTHEISVINIAALLAKFTNHPAATEPVKVPVYAAAVSGQTNLPNNLLSLVGVRERVRLPNTDFGPRAVVVIGHTAYIANYFSDTLSMIDLSVPYLKAESIPLGPKPEMNIVRQGEFNFHNAGICFQGWQSCSSCHPGDARADGLNWDLLNDGVGNPKNTKSLLLAHQTPPVMSLGVRTNAEAAVRAGIRHILFTEQPEEVPKTIDAYLKSLKPVPSPFLVHGKLSEAAKRGEKLFSQAGCVVCHAPGLYTDLHHHNVGTNRTFDKPTDKFYTPTLIEVWRTAPYLHDGSATTVRDVLTTRNADGLLGDVSGLSNQEIDDLCEYVLSL